MKTMCTIVWEKLRISTKMLIDNSFVEMWHMKIEKFSKINPVIKSYNASRLDPFSWQSMNIFNRIVLILLDSQPPNWNVSRSSKRIVNIDVIRLCLLRRARVFAHHRASKSLSVRAIYRASRQVVPRVFRLLINELATRYQQSFNS